MGRSTKVGPAALVILALLASCSAGGSNGTVQAATTSAPASVQPGSTASSSTTASPTTTVAATTTTAAGGVTATTVRIGVLAPDFSATRLGTDSDLYKPLTSDQYVAHWTRYFDAWNAAGGINGRQIVAVPFVYKPERPSTLDPVCAAATADPGLFLVVGEADVDITRLDCVVKDHRLLAVLEKPVDESTLTAAQGSLFTLEPPPEVLVRLGVTAALKQGVFTSGVPVAVETASSGTYQPTGKAAHDALAAAGVAAVDVESILPIGSGTQDATKQASDIDKKGVKDLLVFGSPLDSSWVSFAAGNIPHAVGVNAIHFWTDFFDVAPTGCGVTRFALMGVDMFTRCLTTRETAFAPAAPEKPHARVTATPFETSCLTDWATFTKQPAPGALVPVVSLHLNAASSSSALPAGFGSLLAPANDPWASCTIANLVKTGLSTAAPLTADSFRAALYGADLPVAGMSNGAGRLAAGKFYVATAVHFEALSSKVYAAGCDDICLAAASDWLPLAS